MEKIANAIASYFKNHISTHYTNHQKTNDGWLESQRVDSFNIPEMFNCFKIEDKITTRLDGAIFMAKMRSLSIVVSYYDDGMLLWLDSHLDNEDFSSFIYRENLSEWLPYRLDDFVELLLVTKFNYFGEPKVIKNVDDIPKIPYSKLQVQKQIAESSGSSIVESILENETRKLKSVSSKISSPTFEIIENDKLRVNFSTWTSILGRVLNFSCSFGKNHAFKYEFDQLAQYIGNCYVPR